MNDIMYIAMVNGYLPRQRNNSVKNSVCTISYLLLSLCDV